MTTKEELDERYGRGSRRTRRTWLIIFAAIAVVAVGVLGWSVYSSTAQDVDVDDLGFTVASDAEVEVSFRVTSSHDAGVVCVIEALDESFGIVGWEIVELPSDGSVTSDYTRTVQTVDTATTGYVNTCSLR